MSTSDDGAEEYYDGGGGATLTSSAGAVNPRYRAEQQLHNNNNNNNNQYGDDIQNLNKIPRNLRYWNLAATIFQFAQAGVLFYLSLEAKTEWTWYTHFPVTLDDRNSGGFGVPNSKQVISFSVIWYSAGFLALSGLNHLSCILLEPLYHYYLERHQNPFRWLEYSLSASGMRVMIAQLSGISDLHLLFTIFLLTAMTMLLGACHESINAKARADGGPAPANWFPFVLAWLPHLGSWAVIGCYFFYNVTNSSDTPLFVWFIIFILFILDGVFAILFWLQWSEVSPYFFDDYIVGEKGFIVLSFTAKACLAWINYGGGSR